MGNPWIFEEIISYLKGEVPREISIDEKLQTILEHIELEVEEKGEVVGIKELRKIMSAYIKGMPNATDIRDKINKIEKKDELEVCIIEYFKTLRI